MIAKPREVRQARAFLFRRGLVVSSRYCRVFVGTAKVLRVSFAQLDDLMQQRMMEDRNAGRGFCPGDKAAA